MSISLPILINTEPERMLLGVNAFELPLPPREVTDQDIREVCDRVRAAASPPPGFDFSRRLYRNFGVDPTRYRPSSESLWRRMRTDLAFPRVHPAVDATNLLSLQLQIPFGLYDAERIRGDITAAAGTENSGYESIGRGWISLANKPMLRDEDGPFGNPSADSARTRVTNATRILIHVIFFHPQDPRAEEITHWALHEFARLSAALPLDCPPVPA
ncbi:MAG: hypothetical protein JXA62_04115 [Candidatus Aminicenantes bacterium]|nr:hypothetical protein [Candidatus Aminicenantes bacterium]